MSGNVILGMCSWKHGKTRFGEATFVNAPDQDDQDVLIAIVSAGLTRELRESVAKTICNALEGEYS